MYRYYIVESFQNGNKDVVNMDRTLATEKLEKKLSLIFSWSMAKLYDKNEAEDLAQEIVYRVLSSVDRLEKEEAFWGYVWKISDNTLRTRIRKKQKENQNISAVMDQMYVGTYWTTPEDEMIKSEEIQLLRRELSLLSSQYRNATVQYYIYGKSCSQISAELDISVEMVKYYLFKARKILKEGIGMTREFGEKSYNPQVFRMGYWGDEVCDYWRLFDRKLPGNILLAAKDKPVSLQELSVELGVAVAYLEDEVAILESHEFLKEIGDKYQTNIIILTNEFEKKVLDEFKPTYVDKVTEVHKKIVELLPKLKETLSENLRYDDNCMQWVFTNIAMSQAVMRYNEDVISKKYGTFPMLSNGCHGFVFGFDNDYENHHLNVVYNYEENGVWSLINNYRILKNCQFWTVKHWDKCKEAMMDAVRNNRADEDNDELIRLIEEGFIKSEEGFLFANFPVFTKENYELVKRLLEPVIDMVVEIVTENCKIAEDELKKYVPLNMRKYCGHLANVHYQVESAAVIIEEMEKVGLLMIPSEKSNVCMFSVVE